MPYAQLDDGYPDHPKIAVLSDAAFRAHVSSICYCTKYLTDGRIPQTVAIRLVENRRKVLDELTSSWLWVPMGDGAGFEVRDFLQWNKSRQEVEDFRAKRSKAGRASAASRVATPGGTPDGTGVTTPDGTPVDSDVETGVLSRRGEESSRGSSSVGGSGGEDRRLAVDEIVRACGGDPRGATKAALRTAGVKVAEIREAEAKRLGRDVAGDDPELITEIRKRAERYLESQYSHSARTPASLASHWHELGDDVWARRSKPARRSRASEREAGIRAMADRAREVESDADGAVRSPGAAAAAGRELPGS